MIMSSDSINKEYKYYFLNYIHITLYLIIFILSYYITYTYKFPFCLIDRDKILLLVIGIFLIV